MKSPAAPHSVKIGGALIGLLCAATCWALDLPQPPQEQFGALFAAVQTARIFPDSKTFADAVPRAVPGAILDQYNLQRPQSRAALRTFVSRYFTRPRTELKARHAANPARGTSLSAHIEALWSGLERDSQTVPAFSSAL